MVLFVTVTGEWMWVSQWVCLLCTSQQVGALTKTTKTLDQARAVLTCVDVISEKTLRGVVAITAGRGRVCCLLPSPSPTTSKALTKLCGLHIAYCLLHRCWSLSFFCYCCQHLLL